MRLARALPLALAVLAATTLAAGCDSGTEAPDAHAGHDHAAKGQGSANSGGEAAPAATLTKIEPSADYPMTTCVVSGDALDAMDERLAFRYGDEEVQFCCEGCIDEFKESPEAFMKKVRAAKAR